MQKYSNEFKEKKRKTNKQIYKYTETQLSST